MSFTSAGSRWSDVYLAAAGRAVATCGEFLVATALALTLQAAGAGGLAVSGLLLAAAGPLTLLAPLTGRLADRLDSRAVLIGTGIAQAAVCVALAYAHRPATIIALAALLACGLALTQPTLSALVPEMVRRDDLPRASALNQTAGTLGILAGPALAGLLVGQYGVRLPLLLGALGYLSLAVTGRLLRTRRGGSRRAAPEPAGGPLAAPVWRLRRDPLLLAMAVGTAAVIGAAGAINVVEVFYIRETLASSTTMYGLVTGAWTVGALVGTALAARFARRLADDGALVLAALVALGGCCLMILLAASVPAAALLIPIWLAGGAFNGGDNVFGNVVTARRVPPAERGQAFAALGATIQGGSMVGYLVGGVLLEWLSPRALVAAAGVAGLLIVAGLLPAVRRVVRQERADAGRDQRAEARSRERADAGRDQRADDGTHEPEYAGRGRRGGPGDERPEAAVVPA